MNYYGLLPRCLVCGRFAKAIRETDDLINLSCVQHGVRQVWL